MSPQLHRTQLSILHSLRYAETERFSTLMRPTEHTSDTFKFHIQKLIKLGYVTKLSSGEYQLTIAGKEFANNLDEPKRMTQKQPKLSVMIVATKLDENGETLYLLQQRARNPHFGFLTEIHGRAEWGEAFEDTAARQLRRQTGLIATFKVQSFRRMRDYDTASHELLEDKLFVIMRAADITGELTNSYAGGHNKWLSLADVRQHAKTFDSTLAIIDGLNSDSFYYSDDLIYDSEDY